MKTEFTYGYFPVVKGDKILGTDEFRFAGKWGVIKDGPSSWLADEISDGTCEIRRKVDPGEGYTILPVGTPVSEGDEYFSHGAWHLSSHTAPSPVSANGGITYRRKVAAHPFYYVAVSIGESIQAGDEYRDNEGHWFPTKRTPGETVYGTVEYRRKVGIDCGQGYRHLKPGETVEAGDEWFCNGKWMTAVEVAELGTDTHRKIEANAKMMAAMMDIALGTALLCPMPPVILSPLAGVSDADLQAELDRRQYRMLAEGEQIKVGDQWKDGDTWRPAPFLRKLCRADVGTVRRKK